MVKIQAPIRLFVLLPFTLTKSSVASTRVSGAGADLNPFSSTVPCKTCAGAIPETAPRGEAVTPVGVMSNVFG